MKLSHSVFAVYLAAVLISTAAAQDYPNKPVRMVVGFAAGGSTDLIARIVANKLSERLAQPFIVEVNTSGGGTGANDSVAKGSPDGYRMTLLTGGFPAQAAMRKSLPYDPVKSFGMVSTVGAYPMAVAVAVESPLRSFKDVLDHARANPSTTTFTIQSIGSLHHLIGEWINIEAGTSMVPIPYKGGAPALLDLLGGRVNVMIETGPFVITQAKGGKLRVLAQSSAARFSLMPDVPPVSEFVKGVDAVSWLGMVVSPGTPRPVVDRLNRELHAILDLPDVKARFAELGTTPMPSSPEEMRERIEREIARWNRVVEIKKIERQ